APPAVRRPDAGARRPDADGSLEVPPHRPVAAGGRSRVWRTEPLPDGQGAQAAGCGDVPRLEPGWGGAPAGSTGGDPGRQRAAQGDVVAPGGRLNAGAV